MKSDALLLLVDHCGVKQDEAIRILTMLEYKLTKTEHNSLINLMGGLRTKIWACSDKSKRERRELKLTNSEVKKGW